MVFRTQRQRRRRIRRNSSTSHTPAPPIIKPRADKKVGPYYLSAYYLEDPKCETSGRIALAIRKERVRRMGLTYAAATRTVTTRPWTSGVTENDAIYSRLERRDSGRRGLFRRDRKSTRLNS